MVGQGLFLHAKECLQCACASRWGTADGLGESLSLVPLGLCKEGKNPQGCVPHPLTNLEVKALSTMHTVVRAEPVDALPQQAVKQVLSHFVITAKRPPHSGHQRGMPG
jgi:hypothetical protein